MLSTPQVLEMQAPVRGSVQLITAKSKTSPSIWQRHRHMIWEMAEGMAVVIRRNGCFVISLGASAYQQGIVTIERALVATKLVSREYQFG